MRRFCFLPLAFVGVLSLALNTKAQINTGSDGSDGEFHPTQSLMINMADHPDGIYQYTSVNIPAGVNVGFTTNARNTPVVWLVQGDVTISGTIILAADTSNSSDGGGGGPGGFRGGAGGSNPQPGQGPGSGPAGTCSDGTYFGGNASYATAGNVSQQQKPAGLTYGNAFLLPLLGGPAGVAPVEVGQITSSGKAVEGQY